MTTKFFTSCKSKDEVKELYRTLAKEHHPDKGGDLVTMQRLNAEYAFVMDCFTRGGKPNESEQYYAQQSEVDERLRSTIEKLVTIPGIEIEVCGLWIWVSGETKPVKDQLKEMGCRWAPKNEKWYFAGVPCSSKGKFSMTDIRNRYGSQIIEREEQKQRYAVA